MTPVSNIRELLKNMQPELVNEKYCFATIDESQMMALTNYFSSIVCIYREKEGLTIVFSEDVKEVMEHLSDAKIIGPFALITLNVASDLLSVGLPARITEVLAREKIPVNAVSAYYHDHIFVPWERKDSAMAVLANLQKSS